MLGFSKRAHGWVKGLIGTSDKGLCKGLLVSKVRSRGDIDLRVPYCVLCTA